MKSKLLILMVLASASAFAASHFSIGVNIGGPVYGPAYGVGGYYIAAPPPPPVYYAAPPSPGYGYAYVPSYYYPVGRRYEYRRGYWTRPPRGRTVWVAPRYYGNRYYAGYWR